MKTFDEFIIENENVKLDSDLHEYELMHKSDDMFQVKSGDFFKEFSIKPYNTESIKVLPGIQSILEKAIEKKDPNDLYSAIKKAETVPYSYGNVFSTPFTLKSISEITMNLDPEQMRMFNDSEKSFLLNSFTFLPKESKMMIVSEMIERAEILCVVIEALFYYIRSNDHEEFYEGKSREEISDEYEKIIKDASTKCSFSFIGPFSDTSETPLTPNDSTAVWICEKNSFKFIITATVSPKELYSEKNIGGTSGMKLTLSKINDTNPLSEYSFFDMNDLEMKINKFYEKILKK